MEIKIKKLNTLEFQAFIKKLLSIDKFIFLKIGEKSTVSSVYLPQRDGVKLVSVRTEEMFEVEKWPDAPVKVSFFNGNKVIEALSHFAGECSGRIIFDKVGNDYFASDFIIETDDLKIKLYCADPSLSFMEMSDEEVKRAFSTTESLFDFEMLTTHADKMKSLFNLDKDKEVFKFKGSKTGVSIEGEGYDAILTHQINGLTSDSEVTVYKKYAPLLDKENYKAVICSNKIVFKSLDTNTLLTIAVAITDDEE
jgi:hypothetical protein